MFPLFVYGYDDKTTHPALTQEIVKFFNKSFSELKLSGEDAEIVIKGSIDEDRGLRWMHHFYDPVYDRGLVLEKEHSYKDPNLALIAATDPKSQWTSSKRWATQSESQRGLFGISRAGLIRDSFSSENDYSWERAVYEYSWGDRKRALEALGHVLHLIQDSSVPDHTRNDPHPAPLHDASPFEKWAEKFNRDNTNISDELKNHTPILLPQLNDYFDSIAKYSNNHFFSKDTIFIERYAFPNILSERNELLSDEQYYTFGISKDGFGNNFRLIKIKRATKWSEPEYSVVDNEKLILSDYWNLLSKQAVLHGAGVVKLFFDEVEKEKQTKVLLNKNKSWLSKQIDGLKNTSSLITSIFKPAEREAAQSAAIVSATPAKEIILPSPPPANTPITPEISVENIAPLEPLRPTEPPPVPSPVPAQISRFPIGAASGLDKVAPTKPMLISPVGENQVFTVTTATFKGRAEKNSTITNSINSKTSTTDSSEDFGFWTLILDSLPQGTSTIEFFSTDEAGNKSEAISSTIFVDSIGPSSSLTVSDCNQSLSTEGCLTTDMDLTLEWSSSASDFSRYFVSCETEGGVCSNFSVSPTATTTTYTVPANNTIYTFKVKAVDIYGNQGTEQSKAVEIMDRPIVINEIAWAGTSATQDQDEWIELYNPTNRTIDISQMKVKSQTDNKPNINLSGTLAAKSYYLIERTDDTTISDITASTTASFGNGSGSGLINTGEVLIIEYKGATIDSTPEISACSGWCAGNSSSYYTMERYDPLSSGTSTTNWGSWSGFLNNGANADGVSIKGTPGKRNSINYLITKDANPLSQNKTLATSSSPYIISNAFTIDSGATLTINPGVVIKFLESSSLTVNGAVDAQGTAANNIVFTSIKDDTYAGDTNQDGSATSPAAGNWNSIKILANGSTFDRVVFRYGGYKDTPTATHWANLRIENASTTLKNSIVEYSGAYGAWFKVATGTIDSNIFRNNNIGSDGMGLITTDGSLVIQNNTFQTNTYGLRMLSAGGSHSLSVRNNTFTSNTEEGIDANTVYPTFSGNSFSSNGTNGVLYQGVISQNYAFSAGTYKISTGLSVSANTTLTFDAGTILKFTNSGSLTIQGNLLANGTNANKVVFTSIKDDSYGGDTNNDSSATTPAKADWSQVHIENATATSSLAHSVFSYGTTGLKLTNSAATIDNVLFKANTTGIKSVGTSTTTATTITFEGNTADDDPSNLIP